MTTKIIQKNIKLSMEFDTFLSKNPKTLKSVPNGASIIFTSSSDRELSAANRTIVRNSKSGKFVEAHKSAGSWEIRPVAI